MKPDRLLIILSIASGLLTQPALAQVITQTFGSGMQISIAQDQKLMLDAAKRVMARDYQGAEQIYSQAIAINRGNIEAYLQRGVVRRELHDDPGTVSDARSVVALVENNLAANPNVPILYYQRGMAWRLLRDYPSAKKDIVTAIRMGGDSGWETDLRAIELEEKTAR